MVKMEYDIDVLISTYNGEKYLKEQLDSLFCQTIQDFKIIIRDDKSTDRTIDVIKEYQAKYPNKIELIEDGLGNLRSSESFMKLLEYSNSEYIMFCDQDDVWLSNKIEISLKKMNVVQKKHTNNIPLLVFTDLKVVDEELNVIKESFWKYQKLIPQISTNWKKLLAQNVITGCTIIINKKAKEVCLPFGLEIMLHDQWIGVNIAKYGKIDYLNEQTILYRQHGSNVAGAYNYGIKYILNKLIKIKNIIDYSKQATNYFNEINFAELVYYKIKININRIIRK
jgi:glycosyltransferase involved in cell wall biosynthesis